ncbi:MAG: tRNA pseudouridine38-40 synthase [Salibacteraceae bacterium]
MFQKKYFYLVHIQYLGFRFHGWAKQPDRKTVHGLIDKTLRFALGHTEFKTMGTSRTDALVSANHSAFELFLNKPLEDLEAFMDIFNKNLPSDIRGLRVQEVDETFNIINTAKTKHYEYLFSFGQKAHPMSASVMSFIQSDLDIELMNIGAALFLGEHNFSTFVTKPKPNTNFNREVILSEIVPNTKYTASFFPETSFIYRVSSKGFMRNQVRLMMGQLIQLGRQEITVEDLEQMLIQGRDKPLTFIAPASGLILEQIDFEL